VGFLLPHLLTDAASRYPENIAVSFGGVALTYEALEEESNRLARLLIKEGVRRGDRVGLFLNKSVETVLGIFAILKTGAAYVPIDPLAPARRVVFILQNCGIRCLLTKTAKLAILKSALPEPWPLDVVLLMEKRSEGSTTGFQPPCFRYQQEAAQESTELPENTTIDTDLAYILYTSGSTGDPKGVMISHLNALTFINWASDFFGIQSTDRLSNHAPFHFDLSIFDLFASTKAGAAVYLIPEGIAFLPGDLVRFIPAHQITVWYSVPSALILLVLHGRLKESSFPYLRLVLFAGEVFPVKYLKSLMQLLPHAQFYNLYGPTETNVCTYYHVRDIPEDSTPLPIGKACANSDVFALNDKLERTKPGEVGDLYVRGSSIMKGYWGLPEKTKQVMLDSKDASGHPEQLYRTGDLVRLGHDESYWFLGRKDHMVKSRGYRIELGEVEAAFYSHPEVEDAVVLALPDEEIGHRLLAIVVCVDKSLLSAADLARHCAQRIPKYMVPEIIEFRDNLPHTSTGKVDRQRLLEEKRAKAD
jgi:amino acid adenylation domain-containing protein